MTTKQIRGAAIADKTCGSTYIVISAGITHVRNVCHELTITR